VQVKHYEFVEREPMYRIALPEGLKEVDEKTFRTVKHSLDAAGIKYVKQFKRVFYRAFFTGDTMLEMGISPCQAGFMKNPITGKRDRNSNKWYGITRVMKDPQRWANKWLSQILHIINSNAKGGIMAEQGARMRRLIDDLLSLSRIEMEEHQPPTGEAPLAMIISAEAEALHPLIAQRNMALTLDLEPDIIAAPANADQLAQVIRNLLGNAVNHGREGGQITVMLRSALGDAPNLRSGAILSVADNGPGIAKHHLPRLTERFYRVDQARSRQRGGSGLGLAIARHIVIRHRGKLSIESTEGVGTKVSVWLPTG
jgi:signal transduction histidine kinase